MVPESKEMHLVMRWIPWLGAGCEGAERASEEGGAQGGGKAEGEQW